MPANFRSYEGQLRLLTAVVAAHPELKLNYKEIAKHYGSDWTTSGIEHFFRPIKKNGKAIQDLVRHGEDAMNFPHQAIHKYFGDSTPDGIQFQFRAIKSEANAMRQGKEAPAVPKTPKTPGGRKRNATSAPSTGRTPLSKKAKQASIKKVIEDLNANLDADDDDSDNELQPLEMTPSKPRYDEQKLRAYQLANGYAQPDPPALESALIAATPEDEDDDLRIVTPGEAGPNFSFAQSNPMPASAGGGGVGDFAGWDAHFPLGTPHYADEAQKASEFDDDDLHGEC